jgi:uncharacterized protein (TIGR03437 family)
MLRHFRLLFLAISAATLLAAAQDRVVDRVDPSRRTIVRGNRHPQALAINDRGAVDPALELHDVTLLLRPDASLDRFLGEQQDPKSANYHKWLTPEQFGDRFGLTARDIDQVTQWLRSEGLRVGDVARGRHWITFSGTTERVGRALGTQFHRYRVKGEDHVANIDEPSVPAALASVVAGFDGLHDFAPRPQHAVVGSTDQPANNSTSSSHALAPGDFATIYNVKSLYDAGVDGAGVGIAVIGRTAIDLSDIQTFRKRYNLPAADPTLVLVGPNPGKTTSGDLVEADLDLEWSGAVAPKANIFYVYAVSVRTALLYAIDQNVAPIVTYSFGACETGSSTALRYQAQQANAQGITVVAASGDSGAAVCDSLTSLTGQAAKGVTLSYPANIPELTAIGGTQFVDAGGSYWNPTNDADGASAKSYIPEAVWNDPNLRGTGGASAYYEKPPWQTGPGVPNDGSRDVPDLSLSAGSSHTPYLVQYAGSTVRVVGTSAGSPAFAGILALLTDSLQKQKVLAQPGLGNVNPTLYRLARGTTDVFHDIVDGDNKIACVQSSPSCVDGMLGYSAAPGFDLATGLGTIDAYNLVTKWNSGTASTTTVTANPAKGDPETPVTLTAIVTGGGKTPPTGTVTFIASENAFGAAPLVSTPQGMTATMKTTMGLLGATTGKAYATYNGDGVYGPSTGSVAVDFNLPASGSFVVPFITPNPVPQAGSSWPYNILLTEKAGVATRVTGITVNGVDNSNLISNFVNANGATGGNIPANNSVMLTGLSGSVSSIPRTPFDRIFVFSGQDADGTKWSRSTTVTFVGPIGPNIVPAVTLTASPSVSQQNPAADPSCRWSQDVVLEEHGGFMVLLSRLTLDKLNATSQIQPLFGTTRLAPFGTLRTTLCWDSTTVAPATKTYTITGSAEDGTTVTASATVNFEPAPAAPAALGIGPQSLHLTAADNKHDATAAIDVNFTGGTPQWKASVSPANSATKWLQISPLSGTAKGQIAIRAATAGLSNGIYQASVAFEAPGATPDHLSIPVTLVVGPAEKPVAGIANAASFAQAFAPGMLMSVFVEGLPEGGGQARTLPLPLTLGGITATVNGVAAPMWGVFPGAGQVNLQVPYEAGAGPSVLAINNGGKISEYRFNLDVSAPGLFGIWDPQGRPVNSAKPGQTLIAYITGDGDVSPFLASGATPVSGTSAANLPKPRQPLSVTVGGVTATILFNGIPSGFVGVTQINFNVPATVGAGPQPVFVTVGGANSQTVTLNIVP